MTKVKVFNFEVSNSAYGASEDDLKSAWCKKNQKKLVSYKAIEDTLNEFLADKTLISMNVNNVDIHYHNNGRNNLIQLVYTIVYSE